MNHSPLGESSLSEERGNPDFRKVDIQFSKECPDHEALRHHFPINQIHTAMAILGVGTEIVECVRIAKMIETHGEQFLERVYTPNEIEYCLRTANANQHFARRWAAKEAAMKAMKCRNQGVRWTDIEIMMSLGDGPSMALSGAAAIWADQIGVEKLHVSMGACRTHATAYVMATDEEE